MAITKHNYPKRGEIVECIFGIVQQRADGSYDYNAPVPPEIVKRRPVVIVGRVDRLFLVVPISSTKEIDQSKAARLHVALTQNDTFPVTAQYVAGTPRWAKAELIESVSVERLRHFVGDQKGKLSSDTLESVQKSIMRAVGLTEWVKEREAAEMAQQSIASAAQAPEATKN